MSSTSLQFISQGTAGKRPGGSDRRLIRAHVMKGKNAGRPRPSTKKATAIVQIKHPFTATRIPTTAYPQPAPKAGRPLLWNDLCLTTFPGQLDSESTKLMHRWFFDISDELFPPQFCSKFDIVKSIWANCVLIDEAYFHCTLAISASYVDFYERRPRMSSKALYHISQAYSLVNKKLSGPDFVSDNAIAAVVSLAIYQQIHHLYSTGLIHLDGLRRMIELRGGMAKLIKQNRALAVKPLRLDAELALQTGCPPIFCSDFLETISHAFGHPSDLEVKSLSVATEAYHVMMTMMSFARSLNSNEGNKAMRLDPLTYTEILVWLLYRSIEISPLGQQCSASGDVYNQLACFSMLAFMTTLLPEYGRYDSSYPLLSQKLENIIQNINTTPTYIQHSKLTLLLWGILISGISVSKSKDYRWLIMDVCEQLELHDWLAVRHQLCQFPWINAVHDIPGQYLWNETQQWSSKSVLYSLKVDSSKCYL
ncbi:hypothetical protein DL95DRAFT_438854 [Leptodontidium sp. 2 PMI_412]|nr:hypothetical protein DL95DRAFT_438854 [Leptodontidium sp. 2 PMI_412]